jgi:hypothetical protein
MYMLCDGNINGLIREQECPLDVELHPNHPGRRIPRRAAGSNHKTRHTEQILQKLLLLDETNRGDKVVSHAGEGEAIDPSRMNRRQLQGRRL